MPETNTYSVVEGIANRALTNNEKHLEMYQYSVCSLESFWNNMGKRIDWIKPYSKIKDISFAKENLHLK